MPSRDGLRLVHSMLIVCKLRDKVSLIVAGKVSQVQRAAHTARLPLIAYGRSTFPLPPYTQADGDATQPHHPYLTRRALSHLQVYSGFSFIRMLRVSPLSPQLHLACPLFHP